jgi:hypothetical protein
MSQLKDLTQKENFWPIFIGCIEEARTVRELCRIYESKTRVKLTSHLYQKKIYEEMEREGYIKEIMSGDGREKKFVSNLERMEWYELFTKTVGEKEIKEIIKEKNLFSIDNALIFFNNDFETMRREGKLFILAVIFACELIEYSIRPLAGFIEILTKNKKKFVKEITKKSNIPADNITKRLDLTFYITCREARVMLDNVIFHATFYGKNFVGLVDKILKENKFSYSINEINKIVEEILKIPLFR